MAVVPTHLVCFSAVKAPERGDHSLVPRLGMSGAIPLLPLCAFVAWAVTILHFEGTWTEFGYFAGRALLSQRLIMRLLPAPALLDTALQIRNCSSLLSRSDMFRLI
jgi:hypothetical protein